MADSTPLKSNILIFGATGLIGKFIIEQIIAAKEQFGRIAIFTSPSTVKHKKDEVEKLKGEGVEIIVGDVGKESDVRNAYEGVDTVISAVGRNVIANQIDLLKWADSTSTIKRFFPSEYGTDIEYGPQSASEKPHQQKLKVRKFITENIQNVEVTYLVTGPYSDLFLGKAIPGNEKAGTFDVAARKAVVIGDGTNKISFTTMKDVGVLLVAALLHPPGPEEAKDMGTSKSKARVLRVNSFTTTPSEIVREFEKQTNSKFEVEYTSLEDAKEEETERWEKGDPLATLWTLTRIWAEGGTLYDRRDNERIGEPATEGLEEQVRKSIEKQRKG